MEYTQITQQMKDELKELIKIKDEVDMFMINEHPSYFMAHMLGRKPFTYQHLVFDTFKKGCKRIIICSSRQVGKSVLCEVLALWSALFNKFASGIHRNTKVGIISKSDAQAKKVMSDIRKLIDIGDRFIKKTWGKQNYISSHLVDKYGGEGVQSKEHMDFKNGSFIKSFPPTETAIRGETLDLVIIDEAAFIEDKIYAESIKPTISSVNGSTVLSSTPKGKVGFYAQIFDVDDILKEHEYTRFWFPYWICESETQMNLIEEEKKVARDTGNYKSFQQEYEAMFTVDATAFFDNDKVDKCVNDDLDLEYEWDGEDCILGLDYGITLCHTVISVSTKINEKIRLLYQHAYPFDEDYDIIADITNLKNRFPIVRIVADNGSPGVETNKAMKRKGWNVDCYDFRSFQHRIHQDLSRNRGYYALRVAIHNELVEFPRIPELIKELKDLQEVPMKVNVAIQKPRHGFDDRADSMMMSMIPFITDNDGNFDFELVTNNPMQPTSKMINPRYDEVLDYYTTQQEEINTWLNQQGKKK